MILQIKVIGKNKFDGATRVIAIDGHGFTYEGGINKDMDDAIAGREITYFKVEINENGVEVGEEVTESEWSNK